MSGKFLLKKKTNILMAGASFLVLLSSVMLIPAINKKNLVNSNLKTNSKLAKAVTSTSINSSILEYESKTTSLMNNVRLFGSMNSRRYIWEDGSTHGDYLGSNYSSFFKIEDNRAYLEINSNAASEESYSPYQITWVTRSSGQIWNTTNDLGTNEFGNHQYGWAKQRFVGQDTNQPIKATLSESSPAIKVTWKHGRLGLAQPVFDMLNYAKKGDQNDRLPVTQLNLAYNDNNGLSTIKSYDDLISNSSEYWDSNNWNYGLSTGILFLNAQKQINLILSQYDPNTIENQKSSKTIYPVVSLNQNGNFSFNESVLTNEFGYNYKSTKTAKDILDFFVNSVSKCTDVFKILGGYNIGYGFDDSTKITATPDYVNGKITFNFTPVNYFDSNISTSDEYDYPFESFSNNNLTPPTYTYVLDNLKKIPYPSKSTPTIKERTDYYKGSRDYTVQEMIDRVTNSNINNPWKVLIDENYVTLDKSNLPDGSYWLVISNPLRKDGKFTVELRGNKKYDGNQYDPISPDSETSSFLFDSCVLSGFNKTEEISISTNWTYNGKLSDKNTVKNNIVNQIFNDLKNNHPNRVVKGLSTSDIDLSWISWNPANKSASAYIKFAAGKWYNSNGETTTTESSSFPIQITSTTAVLATSSVSNVILSIDNTFEIYNEISDPSSSSVVISTQNINKLIKDNIDKIYSNPILPVLDSDFETTSIADPKNGTVSVFVSLKRYYDYNGVPTTFNSQSQYLKNTVQVKGFKKAEPTSIPSTFAINSKIACDITNEEIKDAVYNSLVDDMKPTNFSKSNIIIDELTNVDSSIGIIEKVSVKFTNYYNKNSVKTVSNEGKIFVIKITTTQIQIPNIPSMPESEITFENDQGFEHKVMGYKYSIKAPNRDFSFSNLNNKQIKELIFDISSHIFTNPIVNIGGESTPFINNIDNISTPEILLQENKELIIKFSLDYSTDDLGNIISNKNYVFKLILDDSLLNQFSMKYVLIGIIAFLFICIPIIMLFIRYKKKKEVFF